MGAQGSQIATVVEKANKQRLRDLVTHECADAIDIRLRTVTVEWLQTEYGLSADDAQSVHKAIRRMRLRIDPIGDWR